MKLRCLFPDLGPMIGFAATATCRARGVGQATQNPLYGHTQELGAPRVLVVQDLDDPPGVGALLGEVQCNIFQQLGCVGAVMDGGVRDLSEVHALGFQYFARGAVVSHAYVRVEEADVPVTVGGLRVNSGDLIFGDQHGVLQIPMEIAGDLMRAADEVREREQKLIGWVRSNEFTLDELSERGKARN